MNTKRVFIIVLDSVGIGNAPDAADFGDLGANTMKRISASDKFNIPNLIKLGLGNIDGIDYLPKAEKPGAACAVMNAANEAAVGLYLEEKIGFLQICEKVTAAVEALGTMPADSVEDVLAADREARRFVYELN